MTSGRFRWYGWTGDRGQSLVEVALTLPLLLLLVIGGFEFACMGYATIEVSNAAKAAVEYGSQEVAYTSDKTGMQNAINDEITKIPGLGSVTLNSSGTTLACSDGTVPTDGTTGGPYSNTDCANSRIQTTLSVTTTATFSPGIAINSLLKVCNIPTPFTLTGNAIQVVQD